jgi:hypothetical protein
MVANAKEANWSALDRYSLYSYFYSLHQRVVGKKLTPDQIHRLISKHIKSLLPVRIKKHIDAKILQRHIYIGGVYYSGHDQKDKPAIEINFSYHPFDEHLKMTEYRWRRMSLRFADTLLHEIIHMRQFRARGFKELPGYQSTVASAKDRKQQEYYGDRDEMGAFAFNIACEMIDRFGYEPTTIKKYMDTNRATRHKNSWWFAYLKYFDFDHDHKIIRRMKRKILTQLENAYIGKPFKTVDWLTR